LTTFGNSTADELEAALVDLAAKNMRALVLDLRFNSGGYLSAAQEIAGKFLTGRQMVCYWEGRNSSEAPKQELFTRSPGFTRKFPLVVLVNRFSASASEIVAGALQDHKRALIVGERTVGKGSVQRLYPLRSRPSETFTDEPRMNGIFDIGERFQDSNENQRWDPGEPFEDRARLNQKWDAREPFEDKNGNNRFDEGEPFSDQNANGVYDDEEAYVDANNNGTYDLGPEIKLTIARYYLPSGRSIHAERDNDGKILQKGGVLPDELISVPPAEGWKQEERTRIRETGKIAEFVATIATRSHDQLVDLAESDGGEFSQYPGFEDFFAQLATPLSKEDVRVLLRQEVRRQASDLRGREFVGDVEADQQLLRAVHSLLNQLGESMDAVPGLAPLKSRVPEPETEKNE
jgi:hypothetical protein